MKFCTHCGTMLSDPTKPCPKCHSSKQPKLDLKKPTTTQSDNSFFSALAFILSIIFLACAIIHLICANNSAELLKDESYFLLGINDFLQSSGLPACGIIALCLALKNMYSDGDNLSVLSCAITVIAFILYLIATIQYINNIKDFPNSILPFIK